MSKKYTMEEFEAMFMYAQSKAMEKLTNDFKEALDESGKKNSGISQFAFDMQNMMCYALLHNLLFSKED